MTAPVPPDANGLREAVERLCAAAEWHAEQSLSRTFTGELFPAVVQASALRALLAASEAAPTAGERGCCDLCEGAGGSCWQCRGTGHCHAPDPTCVPATPPADDAGEGLSEAEREALGSHGHSCRFPDDECKCTVPLFEHRRIVSAAATRARAEGEQAGREDNSDHAMCYVHGSHALAARDAQMRAKGAAEALREAADAIWSREGGYTAGVQWGRTDYAGWLRARAASIARSDAAPDAGGGA